MTSTARWAIAQRRKRLVISQTLRDRAQTDPRRSPATKDEASES
ncbi:hypothetical protein [Actinocorallia populi]|nr:hypothetical protein [Actinocorallia populi]